MAKHEFTSKDSLRKRAGAKISIVDLERYTDEGLPLLMGITMNVQAGQVVGIIGPSGSGKSTLLRSLNRLWEPPAGTVFLDGVDITELNVLTARRRVGMLFQTPQLFEGKLASRLKLLLLVSSYYLFPHESMKLSTLVLHSLSEERCTKRKEDSSWSWSEREQGSVYVNKN